IASRQSLRVRARRCGRPLNRRCLRSPFSVADFEAIHGCIAIVEDTDGTPCRRHAARKGGSMSTKTTMLCVALGVGAIGLPTVGSARVYVDVDIAPPPARVEVIPEARVGYVWAPGYWRWGGHEHVWVNGHYIRERHGHHWVADTWEPREHRWHYVRGHWD